MESGAEAKVPASYLILVLSAVSVTSVTVRLGSFRRDWVQTGLLGYDPVSSSLEWLTVNSFSTPTRERSNTVGTRRYIGNRVGKLNATQRGRATLRAPVPMRAAC